jgi:hypothetical protein
VNNTDRASEPPAAVNLGDLLNDTGPTHESYTVIDERTGKAKRKPKPTITGTGRRRMIIGLAFVFIIGVGVVLFSIVFPVSNNVSEPVLQATAVPVVVTIPAVPLPAATPTMIFDYRVWNWAYPVILAEDAYGYPAGTKVQINSGRLGTDGEWIYMVAPKDGLGFEVGQSQLTFPLDGPANPAQEPVSALRDEIGMGGYRLIITENVGIIPAGTRVHISHARLDWGEWWYVIADEREQGFVEVRQWQLAYAPGIQPGATPTMIYDYPVWNRANPLMLAEAVQGFPAGTRVWITSSTLGPDGWRHEVRNDDYLRVIVNESQLIIPPDAPPDPTITPSPPTPVASG